MTMNKQFINLLGILLAVVVVVAGLALIAMPMYSQAQTTDSETQTVTQGNAIYQAQIDGLSAANARIDEIDLNVADLRVEIAAAPKLDDVFEIVATAAQQADVRIESVVAGDVEQWIPRTAIDAEGNAIVAAPVEVPAADTATAEDAAAIDGDGAEVSPEVPAEPAESPQRQVLLTVTIDVAQPFALAVADADAEQSASTDAPEPIDPAAARAAATAQAQKAAAFVDSLAVGPRLLSPINVAYTGGKLTLSVLAFIRTEDAK